MRLNLKRLASIGSSSCRRTGKTGRRHKARASNTRLTCIDSTHGLSAWTHCIGTPHELTASTLCIDSLHRLTTSTTKCALPRIYISHHNPLYFFWDFQSYFFFHSYISTRFLWKFSKSIHMTGWRVLRAPLRGSTAGRVR